MAGELIVNGRRIPITVERYLIGRGEGCDILLPEDDMGVSRRHAMLERGAEGEWTVLDTSSNGTLVNNQRITDRRALQHGDKIVVGRTVIELTLPRSRPTVFLPSPVSATEEAIVAIQPAVHAARMPEPDVPIAPQSPAAFVEAGLEDSYTAPHAVVEPAAVIAAEAPVQIMPVVDAVIESVVQAPVAEIGAAGIEAIAPAVPVYEAVPFSESPTESLRVSAQPIEPSPSVFLPDPEPMRMPEPQRAAPIPAAIHFDPPTEVHRVLALPRTPQVAPLEDTPPIPDLARALPANAPMTKPCVDCGAPLQQNAVFCGQCGVGQNPAMRAQMPAPAPAPAPMYSAPVPLPVSMQNPDRVDMNPRMLPRTNPPVFYKNPSIAVLLSFFWTGLGQCYNGEIGKGLTLIVLRIITIPFLFIFIINFLAIPFVIALWAWGMYDAHKSAERINRDLANGLER